VVEILRSHVRKWEMRPVETILRMGRGVKENDGGAN
jgi:hypothetical protein